MQEQTMIPLGGRQILVWGTIALLWSTFAPISLFYLYIYHKYRDKMELNKRHHETVVSLVLFCIFFWVIERTYGLIWSSKIYGESITGTVIHYIIFPFTIYGICWILVWRYWLVYYDIKFARSASHSKWKSILNPKNDDKAWFIVNKQTYGNSLWTFKRFATAWFVLFLVSAIIQILAAFNIYEQRIATLIDGVLNIMSLCVLFVIWFKTPRFEDNFFIAYELKIMIYAYLSLFVWYFIGNILATVFKWDEFVFNYTSSLFAIIITTIFVYICTRWTLNKFILNSDSNISTKRLNLSASILSPRNNPQIKVSDVGMSLKLYQLLAHNNALNCFMDNLVYEFSVECLLSFIEMIQFKKSLRNIVIKNQKLFEKHDHDISEIIQLGYIKDYILKSRNYYGNGNKNGNGNAIRVNSDPIDNVILSPKVYNIAQLVKQKPKKKRNPELIPRNNIMFNADDHESMLMILKDSHSDFNYSANILLFDFPDKVPMSSIVANTTYDLYSKYRDNDNNDYIGGSDKRVSISLLKTCDNIILDYKMKAYELYLRYIHNSRGCNLEININYSKRNKLIKLMDNIDKWIDNDIEINELFNLFDKCIEEMYSLMKDSFQRFKQTAEFQKLDKKIFTKNIQIHKEMNKDFKLVG